MITDVAPVARWWVKQENGRIRCTLCPRFCEIPAGSRGFCQVRRNLNNELVSTAYGRSTGFAADPIEKKPLYHFYPGSTVLSFGTIGCNLGCKFCQNWQMSKNRDDRHMPQLFTPEQVVQLAIDRGCQGIAYTYNDPIIFGEWVIAIADRARSAGLKNVLVSNGYITAEAREDIYRRADAINVDLKAFSNDFYRRLTLSKLAPVLDTLRWLVRETAVWVEITTLVIPGENDSEVELRELTRFVAGELGPDIPLHFSAFHPDFKLHDHSRTPLTTLTRAYEIARMNGLNYVYLGNVDSATGRNTVCHHCGSVLIERRYYQASVSGLRDGACAHCGQSVPGWFGSGVRS
ncbi:MAG: AmmeMemoRadiSam system radical SAM enzyme [Candidatus Neomarinimicrobiota bacterium]